MKWIILLMMLIYLLVGLAGCNKGPTGSASPAANTMSTYLKALVDKDENKMTSLVCPTWQADALIELDAFQAVQTSLQGLSCRQTGGDNQTVFVKCQGKIMAKYVSETQEFDLSNRNYRLEKNGENWLVCGYSVE